MPLFEREDFDCHVKGTPVMSITILLIIYNTILALIYFAVAKIFTLNWKIRLKESSFIIISSLVVAILKRYSVIGETNVEDAVIRFALDIITHVALYVLFFLYFYKLNSYPIKKAFILLISMTLVFLSPIDLASITIINFVWLLPTRDLNVLALENESVFLLWFSLVYGFRVLLFLMLSLPLAFLTVKLTKKLRKAISDSNRLQTILFVISIAAFAVGNSSWILRSSEGHNPATDIFSQNALIIFGTAALMLAAFFLYARFLKAKLVLQQKEVEQRSLLFYVDEIEKQQTAIRKFKHDYQNILLSLEGFFEANDFAAAREYYYTQVKMVSEVITKDNFTLDRLSKIKMPEIKGLLISKLMMAQGDGIATQCEVEDTVDQIPLDSVVLVRALGIILDNAIEELRTLGSGKLAVACYKVDDGITFVVQNTCRSDIQPIHELEQIGFSTKGNGRGLGLNNLAELVAANASNIALQTSIIEGNFIQKLRIVTGGVE